MSTITIAPERLRAHLRVPMFRDGYALVLSGMITAVFGAAYWVVAAHSYSAEDVGLNSAAISAMMLIAGIAQLNLPSALIRFVPIAGRTTFRLILWSYVTSVGVSAGLGIAFLAAGRHLVPSLHLVSTTAGLSLLFLGSTVAWCVFVLQDAALTGLRKAVWVPVENAGFSLIKLVLLVAFATTFPKHGIFASWTVGSVATLVPVTVFIFARLIPRHADAAVPPEPPPSLRELTRYVAPDYLGALGWLAAVTVIPLVITERIGPTQNAYFALAWVIVVPIFFVSSSMGSSLVVSGVSDPHLLASNLRRMLRQTALIVLPMVAVVELAAPYLLRIFGPAYSEHGTTVLRLLALGTVPHILIALAINAARVRRRMRVVVAIQAAECGLILALTWLLLGRYGVEGAGWAWVLGQTAVAVGVAFWAVRDLELSDRLVPVLGRARNVALGKWREHTLRPMLDEILERFESSDARLLASPASDTLVFGSGALAIKLAHTDAGCRSLSREIEVLAALHADTRLEEWRRLLPSVVSAGRTNGHVYLVEDFVPGAEGRRFVGHPELFARAAEAIGGLHRATATERVVDDELLGRWVEQPLRSLEGFGVGRMRAKLREGLAGRSVSVGWVHGDFVPGNVIFDGYGVASIVDWDQAIPDGWQLLDLIQFALATRLLAEGGELGRAVAGFRLTDAERELLPEESVDLQVAVLLCWLRHVSANLEKSARYASSRAWLDANVKAVLDAH